MSTRKPKLGKPSFDRSTLWSQAYEELHKDWQEAKAAWNPSQGEMPMEPTYREIDALASELMQERTEAWEAEAAKYGAYSATYELADRVLTNQDVSVTAVLGEPSEPPAFNSGNEIVFNFGAIQGEVGSSDFMLSLHGLNHHEVGHLRWTPRGGSELMKWVTQNGYLKAFNVLEDARIEGYMVAAYPSTKAFFTASTLQQIINSPANEGEVIGMFPLLAGRYYLDVDIRQHYTNAFAQAHGAELTREVQGMFDQFTTLSLPVDDAKAKTIIEKFSTLFGLTETVMEQEGEGSGEGDGDQQGQGIRISGCSCSDRKPMKAGRVESAKGQGQRADKVKQSQESNGVDLSDEELNSPVNTDDNDRVVHHAMQLRDEVAQSSEVQSEITQVRSAIKQASKNLHILTKTSGTEVHVKPSMRLLAKQFADELIQAEIDADPYWETEKPSGRLNLQRAMSGDVNGINTLFDRWSFGDTSTEIEAVILIDNSGSMCREIERACESAWVIKRAVEAINGHVSTLTFSTYSKRLYDRDERAMPSVYRAVKAQSSTDPYSALVETSMIMNTSQAANKIVFILTDGYWDSASICNETIKALQENGVMVCLAFMGSGEINYYDPDTKKFTTTKINKHMSDFNLYAHGADIFTVISKPAELIKLAREVVTETLALAGVHH